MLRRGDARGPAGMPGGAGTGVGSAMARPMVEFRDVSKAYRTSKARKVILQNFSGAFPRGRNIGLLGMNGAGKSTLIRLIAGAEFPDRGQIKRHAKISFPLGFAAFKGNLTGRENCRFVARIYGIDTRSVERFVEEFAEIGKYFDMPVASYSSGMRARVSFGVSMAVDFECYLVDETLSVGDGVFKARADAIFAEKRRQASIILVSHSASTVRNYCDMGAVLADGELKLYDELDDAIKAYEAVSRNLASFD
jgi:capsular polysaccharide transport system ATP-binding protein